VGAIRVKAMGQRSKLLARLDSLAESGGIETSISRRGDYSELGRKKPRAAEPARGPLPDKGQNV